MGLDAYVPCRCVARGLVELPVFATLDDGVLCSRSEADDADFDAWETSACPHPGMRVCTARVSNWAGVRTLQDALRHVGDPVARLLEAIPDSNGGHVDATTARACIVELAVFRASFKRATTQLIDATTGALVYDYVAAYDGQFVWSRQGNVGFDARGVWVERDGEVQFRARRVTATPREGGCELRDADDTATVWCAWLHEKPATYEVTDHIETAAAHEDKLRVLEQLFVAAIDHDSVVIWT